nr:MAG TPA: hypothetical protein [Caudoviricetes sp.]
MPWPWQHRQTHNKTAILPHKHQGQSGDDAVERAHQTQYTWCG